MNISEAMTHALPPPPPPFEAALEAVELELALGQQENDERQSATFIGETVASVGGVLLFQMKVGDADEAHWLAAVAFEAGGKREIAVIDLPCKGGAATVNPASQSDLPVASIAAAYAGLAECWTRAA